MRERFPKSVEEGRVRGGDHGTSLGDTWGFFCLLAPGMVKIKVMVGDGGGWDHVSVSIGTRDNRPGRCPTWDEMCWVRHLFFTPEECVIQYHPPASDNISHHPSCLHMWKPHDAVIPMPPKGMIA